MGKIWEVLEPVTVPVLMLQLVKLVTPPKWRPESFIPKVKGHYCPGKLQ